MVIPILHTVIMTRPYSELIARFRSAGLRPTRQRLALGRILFDGVDRHVTAEGLHNAVAKAGTAVSLATIYNALNQFTEAGFLREVLIGFGKSFYDTNLSNHHHIYYAAEDRLEDIRPYDLRITRLPAPPSGQALSRVEIVITMTPD